ncbi:MAG: hypothetical protein J7479_17195 [Roseiflexus sp.]|nr:hypothetical protein [Roseiflexus sp.]
MIVRIARAPFGLICLHYPRDAPVEQLPGIAGAGASGDNGSAVAHMLCSGVPQDRTAFLPGARTSSPAPDRR